MTFSWWERTGAALACVLTLSACGGSGGTSAGGDASPAGASQGSYQIGCTIPTFSHPFFVAMKKGLEEEAAAQGMQINVVDGKDDAQVQLSAIDTFVVQGVNGIILCPTESETLPPGVMKANGAKIPVVTVNRTVASGDVVTYVGADDREGGRMQGTSLVEALPKGAKIVLLRGVLGSSPQREREAGLEEVLKQHPGFEIVDRVVYNFKREEAQPVMETILNKYPKGAIDAVVAQSDDGAIVAADVAAQRGRTELVIVGFNGESDAFDYVRQGKMHATILQDAETQGREAVKAMARHLKGETVENPQITPLFTVTKANIDQHQPAWQSQQ